MNRKRTFLAVVCPFTGYSCKETDFYANAGYF